MADRIRRLKALLADDHERMQGAVEKILGPTYDVVRVADGEELVEQLDRAKPDVLIVDISMPRMSGIEALKKLRERGAAIPPTVICSMHRDSALLEEAMSAGAKGYVYKARAPFDLRDAIEAALDNRRFLSPEVRELAPDSPRSASEPTQ
jgi:DNA-binding NarL/FixJ family response regulator